MKTYLNEPVVREALHELADRDLQHRRWTSTGDELSSFTEALEQLFDDSGLGDVVQQRPDLVGPEALPLIRQLESTLMSIDQNLTPEQTIADPKMDVVRSLARRLLHLDQLFVARDQ